MPFLRVIRDKRGYETTYLMHWCREGTKQKSRILYVFRTPGGVRVGREALESDVLKRIEAEHPDIEFDWNAVFHNQQVIETAIEPRRMRKRPPAEAPPEPVPAQQPVAPRFTVPAAIEGATPACGPRRGARRALRFSSPLSSVSPPVPPPCRASAPVR